MTEASHRLSAVNTKRSPVAVVCNELFSFFFFAEALNGILPCDYRNHDRCL